MIIRPHAIYFTIFSFVLGAILSGCTGAAENSTLLTSGKTCSGVSCGSETQTSIAGELSIFPDVGEIFSTPEGSEMVEIAGTCQDLGRKSNQILVQVYEGESDAVQPILDNSVGINCQSNISTSSLSDQTCLFVSQGIGLADAGQSTVQYPQCFNGRFSFKLRVGRIIRSDTSIGSARNDETNPKVRYLVKLKLRTTDGATADSGATTMFVSRGLLKPVNFAVTADDNNDRCEIKLDPARFRDIRYSVVTTWKGPTYMASGTFTNSVSGSLYFDMPAVFPPRDDGNTVERYFHIGEPLQNDRSLAVGLMPGMNYTYTLQSSDYSFVTDYMTQFGVASGSAVERSDMSSELSCSMANAFVANRTINTTLGQGVSPNAVPNNCELVLGGTNKIGYSLEWRVSELGPNWMVTNPKDGILISTGRTDDPIFRTHTLSPSSTGTVSNTAVNCRNDTFCFVNGQRNPATFPNSAEAANLLVVSGTQVIATPMKAKTPYFFAVRHFRDSGSPVSGGGIVSGTAGNGIVDFGEIVGDWSPASPIQGGTGNNHECNFNTFPATQ